MGRFWYVFLKLEISDHYSSQPHGKEQPAYSSKIFHLFSYIEKKEVTQVWSNMNVSPVNDDN